MEFALVVTLLLVLVFGILEYGRIFGELEAVTGAAREGARVGAVRGTPDEIQAAIEAASAPYTPDFIDYSVVPSQCTDASVGVPISVSWKQHVEVSIPLLPPATKDVQITGVFRCE